MAAAHKENNMETLDINEAAELLKVSTETVRRLADTGALMGAKVGVAWVFIREDLMDYLRQEARRQTAERRAKADEQAPAKTRVKTAVSQAGLKSPRRGRRALPDLDSLEQAA